MRACIGACFFLLALCITVHADDWSVWGQRIKDKLDAWERYKMEYREAAKSPAWFPGRFEMDEEPSEYDSEDSSRVKAKLIELDSMVYLVFYVAEPKGDGSMNNRIIEVKRLSQPRGEAGE